MKKEQNYKNHTRWNKLVHFVLTPLLAFHLIWCAVRLYQEPNWDRLEYLLLAIVLIGINFAARLQALTAQDRLIRLEERLRYRNLLAADLADRASQLRTGQMIALRFACDEELPDLVQRILNGELKTGKEIKLAIQNWRGDYLRV